MTRFGLSIFLAASAAGCYSSTGSKSDLQSEASVDPLSDPSWDPGFDELRMDPVLDEVPPEPVQDPADLPPESPFHCLLPEDVSVEFTIDHGEWPNLSYLEERCTIDSIVQEEEGHTVIDMQCYPSSGITERHAIDIRINPPAYVYLWEGEDVIFRYAVDAPWWVSRWFTLATSGGMLIVAGLDATEIEPDVTSSGGWYFPISVQVANGLCPWEPDECGDMEREALDVAFYGTTVRVFDHKDLYIGYVESYHILIERAVQYHDVICDDFPESWYRAIFLYIYAED